MLAAIGARAVVCLVAGVPCASSRERPGDATSDGLVASWNCNEGSGTLLHDQSGNGNNGSIKGAGWVRNGAGYALQFDGVDDYLLGSHL